MPKAESTETRSDLIARLRVGIEEVKDSERFKAYLKFSSLFHNYSFQNRLLIWTQQPEATRVAGFRSWPKAGRQVRRGERGIAILAPLMRRERNDLDEDVPPALSFKVVYVFDVSQTEGEPIPSLTTALRGDADEVMGHLYAVAKSEGIRINRRAENIEALGYYVRTRKLIWLSPEIESPAQLAQTLAHELSHHFADEDCTRAVGELIADSAAYLVLGHYGIDAGAFSFDYVAAWASRAGPDAWEKSLVTTHRVADRIIGDVRNGS